MLSPVRDMGLPPKKDPKAKARNENETQKRTRQSKWSDDKRVIKSKNFEGITKLTKNEKRKSNAVNSTDTIKPSNVAESSEDLSCQVTRTNIRQSLDLDSGIQSSTDMKSIEKLVIKVSGNNAIRNVSLPQGADHGTFVKCSKLITPIEAPVSCSEQSPLIPVPHSTHSVPIQSPVVVRRPVPLLPRHEVPKPDQPLLLPPLLHQPIQQPLLHQPIKDPSVLQLSNQKVLQNHSLPLNHETTIHSSKYLLNYETKKNYRYQTLNLFRQPCINYLSGQPCEFSSCKYSHTLPSADYVYLHVQAYPNDLVDFVYTDFIVKNATTFERYFPLICHLYGRRNMLLHFTPLLTKDCDKYKKYEFFIKDCEKYKKYDFFECIFDGLLMCGVNKNDALLLIADGCQICSASDQVIHKIVQRDPQCFIDVLGRSTTRVPLSPELLSRLLQQVSNNSDASQLTKCVELLKRIGALLTSVDKNIITTFYQAICRINDTHLIEEILSILSNVTN